VAHPNRTAVAAGTVVILTGLALTFQVLQFVFGTPARAGAHPAAPAAVPAVPPPEPAPPANGIRLSPPAPSGREPQVRLLQPVPAEADVGPPRQVTVARWPTAATTTNEPPTAGPAPGTWARPVPGGEPAPVVRAAEVWSAPRPASVRPMPAAALAPPRRPAARERDVPLTGTHACVLEENETLRLPEAVCRQLDSRAPRTLFVTPGPDRSLWLFTGPGLRRWADDLDRSGSARARAARRVCLAQTEACPVDRQGRLRLPEHLAEFAGLCQGMVVLGVGDHLELWDAPRWQQARGTGFRSGRPEE
jgi:MraZ protein